MFGPRKEYIQSMNLVFRLVHQIHVLTAVDMPPPSERVKLKTVSLKRKW